MGDLSKVSSDGTLKIKGAKQASSPTTTGTALGPEDVVFTISKAKRFQFFDLAQPTTIKSTKIKLQIAVDEVAAVEQTDADGSPLPVYRLLRRREMEPKESTK